MIVHIANSLESFISVCCNGIFIYFVLFTTAGLRPVYFPSTQT